MRTTLSIDDDVLSVLRARAEFERKTLGECVTEIIRQSFVSKEQPLISPNGLVLLRQPSGGPKVTLELVNELRDDDF